MSAITIQVPKAFQQALDELVAATGAPSRELWLTSVVRSMVFDFQIRKDFAPQQMARIEQLNLFWPLS